MYRDAMTSQERMFALFSGKKPDRVPVMSIVFGTATVVCGYQIANAYDNAEISFKSQLLTQEMFGYDGSPVYGHTAYGAEELGGKIEFPYKKYAGAPYVVRPAAETEEDALKLEIPNDLMTRGTLPIALEFSRLALKNGLPCNVTVGSPFTWAGNLVGVERLMRWMIKKPQIVHHVMRKATDFGVRLGEHWAKEFGPERVVVHNIAPTDSNALVSPKQFETFIFPYMKELNQKMIDLGYQLFFTHICGEHNNNLPFWQRLPYGEISILSFGHEVSLKKASEMFPNHIIAGNVHPTIFQEGSSEEVLEMCRRAIEEGIDHPRGFILMPGCELAPLATPVNIYMMVKAAREYGRY